MMARRYKKLVHEGEYAAEVEVVLTDSDEGWSPYLSLDDAERLDEVRSALRNGDVASASKLARVYRLLPISA
ncbi:MAG: hypothetical protein D6696_07385 [Acidobacteria bacterium]|nr:MAG: hypothetical protein D6696_07385 [Acidobacteriota bacterium]